MGLLNPGKAQIELFGEILQSALAMSVPSTDDRATSQKVKTDVSSFYGRSYPRASYILDKNNDVQLDRRLPPPSANAPLLDWAKKADWKMGGARVSGDKPQAPRPAFTPVYAFLARRQLKIKTLHPFLSTHDASALAKLDAAAEWDKLTEEEQDLYVQLADQDAVRFDREMKEFEQQHPGWLASRRGAQKPARAAMCPRKPLTAFMAFLQDKLRDVAAAENVKTKDIRKETAQEWKEMTPEDKAPFEKLAEEDLLRWEAELEKYPEYKARMEERVRDRLAKQQERAAKTQIFKAAKKRPTRPGKLGLPKPKPIVKNGKLTRSTGKAAKTDNGKNGKRRAAAKRRRKAQKVEEEVGSESDTEPEPEPGLDDSGSEDDLDSKKGKQSEDERTCEEAKEDDDIHANGEGEEEEASGREEADVEISDTEGEQEQPAKPSLQALADEAALDTGYDMEEEDDALRAAKTPSDLLVDSSKDGLFGWAKSALMSGIRGVWSRGQTEGEIPKAEAKPAEEAGGEALIGRSFTKFFGGKPFVGQVKSYIPEHRWYYVEYEDDDNEELVEAELLYLLSKSKEGKDQDGDGKAAKKRKRALAKEQ